MGLIRGALFGLAGLAFGSFLTVVVHRVPRRESIVSPRSACPSCGKPIAPRDNIPVVSYVLLRGRCRHCRSAISAEYPIVEALTCALFVTAAAAVQPVSVAAMIAPFLGLMLACSLIDIRHRIIPNKIVYPSLVLFAGALVALAVADEGVSLATAGLGLLSFGGGLLLISLVFGGMGMGDVKLGALIGLVLGALGWRYVGVAAMGGILAGGLGAVVALLMGRSRKDVIPFGPYIGGAAIVSALWAPEVAAWYLRVLT
jgi:leader peptidase (prepilin peptidase)/N-methyltransferase